MFFVLSTPGMIIIFYVDILRQMHLGMNNYISAGICEIFNFMWSVLACWLFGFKFEWGFHGLLMAIPVGQGLGFVGYFLNFVFNPNFKQIPKIFSCEDLKCLKKSRR
jgi:hypothetical protein